MDRLWGLSSTSFGKVKIGAGEAYPPSGHPEHHYFDWRKGRILQDYQLIYIREGEGVFKSAFTKQKKIQPGSAFVLYPGVWHQYRPSSSTGWTEAWIELNGPYLERLISSKILDPRQPLYNIQNTDEVEALFDLAHLLARTKPPGFSVRLGLLAIQILTCFRASGSRRQVSVRRVERLISKSLNLLSQGVQHGVSAKEIAQNMGIAYSYFRREFKRQTGLSPKQYQLNIRHRRARNLLLSSPLNITEIADQLGYSSPYHFSLDFLKHFKMPPSKWRAAQHKRLAKSHH